jgi:hypothetical protein
MVSLLSVPFSPLQYYGKRVQRRVLHNKFAPPFVLVEKIKKEARLWVTEGAKRSTLVCNNILLHKFVYLPEKSTKKVVEGVPSTTVGGPFRGNWIFCLVLHRSNLDRDSRHHTSYGERQLSWGSPHKGHMEPPMERR